MSKYLELAEKQFSTMKNDSLYHDRHCVGGETKKNYEVDGLKIEIEIHGFWEKSDWFEYTVTDLNGNELEDGTEY